jgi:hypothetical protein
MIMALAFFGAGGACDRAVGAVLVGSCLHGFDALTAFALAFSAEAHAFLHAVHSFASVTAFLASFGTLFAILDAFLHCHVHLHAAYYAVFGTMSPP